jgi:hypothetical protein
VMYQRAHMTGVAWNDICGQSEEVLSPQITMATTASTSTPSSPLPSTASTLWAHLLNRRSPSKANATQPHSYAQLTPQDKAGTSTRILLHDTHARLEQFSERANSIFSAIETSKREMVRVREEVESAREKELDAIAQLSMFSFPFSPHICQLARAHVRIFQSIDASHLSKRRSELQCRRATRL